MDAGKFRRIWYGWGLGWMRYHDTIQAMYYIIPRVYKYEYSRFLG